MNEHIEEMQVTIKVLRVGKKQFTISLLNQLPVKELIVVGYNKEKGHYVGVKNGYDDYDLWGYVRYKNTHKNSIILLWQYNNIIYAQWNTVGIDAGIYDEGLSHTDVQKVIDTFELDQIFIGV